MKPMIEILRKDWPAISVTVIGAISTGLVSTGRVPADVAGAIATGVMGVITIIARRLDAKYGQAL